MQIDNFTAKYAKMEEKKPPTHTHTVKCSEISIKTTIRESAEVIQNHNEKHGTLTQRAESYSVNGALSTRHIARHRLNSEAA